MVLSKRLLLASGCTARTTKRRRGILAVQSRRAGPRKQGKGSDCPIPGQECLAFTDALPRHDVDDGTSDTESRDSCKQAERLPHKWKCSAVC